MLGHNYQYAFAPAQGMSGTLRANGRGYVSGLGASTTVAYSSLNADQRNQVATYMASHPTLTDDQAATELFGGGSSSIDWTKVTGNVSQATDALAKMGLSIVQITNALRGRYPQQDIDTETNKLKMMQYLPWAIGGGAILIGLFLVMGTRRRR
jgi:hypothetical protein